MDSKTVVKALAARVWPALGESGFTERVSRVCWRRHEDRIDVIVFRFFNTYDQKLYRLKPGSFWTELACHLHYVRYPLTGEEHLEPLTKQPAPEICLFRSKLQRGFRWPFTVSREMWPVGAWGVGVEKAVEDVRVALLEGLRWFDQFATPEGVAKILDERQEHMTALYGFGLPGSPLREYARGYVALHRGQRVDAKRILAKVVDSGKLAPQSERIRRDIALL